MELTLCNGQAQGLPPDDRGALLGDALFETVLVRDGRAIWLDEHLARMQAGCQRLRLDFPAYQLQQDIERVLSHASFRCAVLRISLSRCGGSRGYAVRTQACNRLVQLREFSVPPQQRWREGIRSFLCQTPVVNVLPGVKHNNRLSNILARSERSDQQFPEGVMLTHNGCLAEGISSNLFLEQDGALFTPSLCLGIVDGIVRRKILECAAEMGVPVSERNSLTLQDVYQAEGLFFCNSLMGIVPASRLDSFHLPVGNVTRAIQGRFEAVWYG